MGWMPAMFPMGLCHHFGCDHEEAADWFWRQWIQRKQLHHSRRRWWFCHSRLVHSSIHRAPGILLCEQRKLNIMNILLFLFHMQHLAAGGIIFWKSSCAADAVPLLPVSWFSFGRQGKDDSPSQPTWYYFNGTIVDSIVCYPVISTIKWLWVV